MRQHRHPLDASVEAPEPRDFAVRNMRVRLARCRVHRIPQPNVRDDRETPLVEGHGTAALMEVIWAKREAIYFCGNGWTGSISLIGFGKFAVWREEPALVAYFFLSLWLCSSLTVANIASTNRPAAEVERASARICC